jgi:hypothetical protein
LKRPESLAVTGLTEKDVDEFLDGLLYYSQLVVVHRRVRPSVHDPSDEIFVEALLNGGETRSSLSIGETIWMRIPGWRPREKPWCRFWRQERH